MSARFLNQKRFALDRLKNAVNEGEVDEEILSLINYVNSLEDYYTTSSCAGRITVLHDLGTKKECSWLGKWHREVSFNEVKDSLNKIPGKGFIWFRYESPILHIASKKLDDAKKLLNIAREAGYKRVGLQGLREERYLVEICDTDRVDCPIAEKGELLVDSKYLEYLTVFCNSKYRNGRKKLRKFESELRIRTGNPQ